MKRIATYTIILAALWSAACSRQEELYCPQNSGAELVVLAEMVSSSNWVTTRTEDPTRCDTSSESMDGEYLITANIQEWTSAADTLPANTLVTRGAPISSATQINNLRVNIFNTKTANWSVSSPLTQAVEATNVSGGFTTSPSYNWPTDVSAKTSLFAYSPLPNASNGLTNVAPNQIIYIVPNVVSQQPDLCVAVPTMNVINNDGVQQVRTFVLSHQLTAIGFTMMGWQLKITKITVSDIIVAGTLTMNPTGGAHTWVNSNIGSRDVGVTGSSYQHTINSNYTNITTSNGYLMMIPQTLSNAATVTILYESTDPAVSTGGKIMAKLKDLGLTWSAGDKITYNIRLKTAPAVTSNTLTIENSRAGYTTSQPLSFIVDSKDNLTFTWEEAPWLRIYRGSPKTGNVLGGFVSGWSTGVGGAGNNIYFFSTEDNASAFANRTATVTVSGTRSGIKKFSVLHQYLRSTLSLSPAVTTGFQRWSGVTTKITLLSNTSWKVSSLNNCSVTPETGTGNQTVQISSNVNSGLQRNLSCTFTTTSPSNNVEATWTGRQASSPFTLDPDSPNANLGVNAGTYSIKLTTGSNWRIISQKNCTVTPSSGSGSLFTAQTLTLTYTAYNDTVDREVAFVVGTDGRSPITWTTKQEAPYFSLDCVIPTGGVFNWAGYYGGKQFNTFRIVSNTKWTTSMQGNLTLRWGAPGTLPASGFGPYDTQVSGQYEVYDSRGVTLKVIGYRPNGTIIGSVTRNWRQNN